jgi:hypothetical protein
MSYRPQHLLLATTAAVTLSAVSALAFGHTYERCDADGDRCVRVVCDHDGDKCWSQSEHSKNVIYNHPGSWVCDSDGDRCHYEYNGRKSEHGEHHDDDRSR